MWPEMYGDNYGYYVDSGIETRWEMIRKVNPNARLWLIDLAGHNRMPIKIDHSRGVIAVSGWSDRVFEMVEQLSKGSSVLEEIEKVSLA